MAGVDDRGHFTRWLNRATSSDSESRHPTVDVPNLTLMPNDTASLAVPFSAIRHYYDLQTLQDLDADAEKLSVGFHVDDRWRPL